jgi:uncharacterized protein involved in exopolysaccharide biosynthesis
LSHELGTCSLQGLQQGAFSEKEELFRATLAKLDTIDSDTAVSSLTAEDITGLRRQLTEGQQQVRDLMDKLLVTQEASEHHERRKAELEKRFSALETEYEELLGAQLAALESHYLIVYIFQRKPYMTKRPVMLM